jgi:hypothetical protein
MKTAVKILLFIFVIFLSTPTIVSLIEKKADFSIIDDFSDENQDMKFDFNFVETLSLQKNNFKKTKAIIISKCKFKHEMISSRIFIPPPEMV